MYRPEWAQDVWKEAYNDAIHGGASKYEAREYADEQEDMAVCEQANACDFFGDDYY